MMSRPPIEKLAILAFLVMLGAFVADIGLLFVRGGLYPQQPPPATPQFRPPLLANAGNFGGIRDRDLFNADGKIPPALGEAGGKKDEEADPEPVPTTLPLVLLGTIVHANPARSIASIGLKSKNDVASVKAGDIIPDNLATVILVERQKVTFRNNATHHREFLKITDDSKISFGAASFKPSQNGEVTKTSDNNFEIKRDDINRLTNNLPELLQQARAVPRMGPGGVIECFNLADITAGSIYERLGLKKGDCIKSVNGEKIDSPAKAMELYNALRSSANSVNLGIERGGSDDNFQYNINN